MKNDQNSNALGVAIVGLGGAVASTVVAGNFLQQKGEVGTAGLPLAEFGDLNLVSYENMKFAGWDLYDDNLYAAATHHAVLSPDQLASVKSDLEQIKPWKAVSNKNFCAGVTNDNQSTLSLRATIEYIISQITTFEENIKAPVVIINLASTEHALDMEDPIYQTLEAFEEALDTNSDKISPAMLYAYAAISNGNAYGNFTPSVAADIPALIQFALERNVPICGKDGKTGQTFVKTVVAPALRARALKVDGWFSTNILGNRDGQALDKPESLKSKINTKGTVLDSCLNYPVDNHIVQIHYYKPRGDDKEAWDNIDVTGYLGHRMQLKINFLCKDSILAAPLVVEIARCLNLASQRAEGGPVEALSTFFKCPLTLDGSEPDHRFYEQHQRLLDWLQVESMENTKEETEKVAVE